MRNAYRQSFLINLKNRKPWSIKKPEKSFISYPEPTENSSILIPRCKSQSNRSLTPQPPVNNNTPKPLAKHSFLIPKEIFVVLNGSVFTSDSPLKGFFFTIPSDQLYNFNHSTEMKNFFKACQDFFQFPEIIEYLYSYKGNKLTCLHEIPEDSKIVIVGCSQVFQGINPVAQPSFAQYDKAISQEKSENVKFGHIKAERVNSIFVRRVSHVGKILDLKAKSGKSVVKRQESKEKKIKDVKLNVNNLLRYIEKCYPKISEQEMKRIKNMYGLSEARIHSLNAKFKTLVLLSCTVNEDHRPETGVNKKAFVEYQNASEQQGYVIERIFDAFNKNGGETITWEEYFSTVSIIEKGTNEEKVDLFFKVYDTDCSGSLSFSEIHELCRVQLDGNSSDTLIEDLSKYFASLIFDVTQINYDGQIPKEKIKQIVREKNEKSLIDMFCNFKFLKF